jgi:hypothetical protein
VQRSTRRVHVEKSISTVCNRYEPLTSPRLVFPT